MVTIKTPPPYHAKHLDNDHRTSIEGASPSPVRIRALLAFKLITGDREELMAKKSTKARAVIHLECTSCRTSGISGVSRYNTRKSKKNTPARIELMKYCRFERKHTTHKEVK